MDRLRHGCWPLCPLSRLPGQSQLFPHICTYRGGGTVSTASSSFSSKLKGKSKEKSEDDDKGDPEYQILIINVILNWSDHESE